MDSDVEFEIDFDIDFDIDMLNDDDEMKEKIMKILIKANPEYFMRLAGVKNPRKRAKYCETESPRSISSLSDNSSPPLKLEVIFRANQSKDEIKIRKYQNYVQTLRDLIAVSEDAERIKKCKQEMELTLTKIVDIYQRIFEEGGEE